MSIQGSEDNELSVSSQLQFKLPKPHKREFQPQQVRDGVARRESHVEELTQQLLHTTYIAHILKSCRTVDTTATARNILCPCFKVM